MGVLARLRERHPRFKREAYEFLVESMETVMEAIRERRHISGAELSLGARALAIDRFGPLARTVLEYWGIRSTDDLGEIVFALIEVGVLVKETKDHREDFRGVYDFDEAFDRDYPWTVPAAVSEWLRVGSGFDTSV